jgi:hypothetical protein
MINWISRHKFTLVGAALGALGGYIYWYYWGCLDGCTIRSVWWRMSLWGTVMGLLLGNMLDDYLKKRAANSTTEDQAGPKQEHA